MHEDYVVVGKPPESVPGLTRRVMVRGTPALVANVDGTFLVQVPG